MGQTCYHVLHHASTSGRTQRFICGHIGEAALRLLDACDLTMRSRSHAFRIVPSIEPLHTAAHCRTRQIPQLGSDEKNGGPFDPHDGTERQRSCSPKCDNWFLNNPRCNALIRIVKPPTKHRRTQRRRHALRQIDVST